MAIDPEPPFLQHLREIAEGKKSLPDAAARKQHYVPSFLLALWATPQKRDGILWALTVSTGDVDKRKPGKVALRKDLYTLDKEASSINLVIEAFLGVVEQHAADAIKRLAAAPLSISDDDRWTIAYFLAIQQGRTPPGLEQHRAIARAAAGQALHAFFQDKAAVAARYREKINPDAEIAEIRAFAIKEIKAFQEGKRTIELPEEAPFQALLKVVSGLAFEVVQMSWTLLTTADEFVANDRGLAMWDPELPETRGNAWMSSPRAETTFPVGPAACLRITLGQESFAVEQAEAATVASINLRTYGWAENSVFGTNEQILRDLHRQARVDADRVPHPVVPTLPGTHTPKGPSRRSRERARGYGHATRRRKSLAEAWADTVGALVLAAPALCLCDHRGLDVLEGHVALVEVTAHLPPLLLREGVSGKLERHTAPPVQLGPAPEELDIDLPKQMRAKPADRNPRAQHPLGHEVVGRLVDPRERERLVGAGVVEHVLNVGGVELLGVRAPDGRHLRGRGPAVGMSRLVPHRRGRRVALFAFPARCGGGASPCRRRGSAHGLGTARLCGGSRGRGARRGGLAAPP